MIGTIFNRDTRSSNLKPGRIMKAVQYDSVNGKLIDQVGGNDIYVTGQLFHPNTLYTFPTDEDIASAVGDGVFYSNGVPVQISDAQLRANCSGPIVWANPERPDLGITVIADWRSVFYNDLKIDGSIKSIQGITGGSDGVVVPLILQKGTIRGESDQYAISCGNCKNDFSDIEIIDSLGNVLPFYIHTITPCKISTDSRLPKNKSSILLKNGDLLSATPSGMIVSRDGGMTWDIISGAPTAMPVWQNSSGDIFACTSFSFFTGTNRLIRCDHSSEDYSSWTEVLNMSSVSGIAIPDISFAEDSFGSIYFGRYQESFDCAMYKSTDKGVTFTRKFTNTTYQHVHGVYVDKFQYPNVIYAGLDGATNCIIKSVDYGENWTILPGVIAFNQMVSGPGYRLLSGESTILNGAAILKTTDDSTFTPVLNTCSLVSGMQRLRNSIYAFIGSSFQDRYAKIMRSDDDGDSWSTVYIHNYVVSPSTSAGWRYAHPAGYLSGDGQESLFANSLDAPYLPIRITEGGVDDYQALAFVKLPVTEAGAEIKVKRNAVSSGQSSPDSVFGYYPDGLIMHFPLTEGSTTVNDIVGGRTGTLTVGAGAWNDAGYASATMRPLIFPSGRKHFTFGAGSRIAINGSAGDPALNLSQGFTIIAWITALSTSSTYRYIIGRGVRDTPGSLTMGYRGTGGMGIRGGTANNIKEINSFICDGYPTNLFKNDFGPHMLGLVISPLTSPEVYWIFDGMLSTSPTALDTHLFANNLPWYIGSDGGNNITQSGEIYDVQIYNRPLLLAEVRAIFERNQVRGSIV